MTELKTLKDLKIDIHEEEKWYINSKGEHHGIGMTELIEMKEVKQEAIKDIKEIQDAIKYNFSEIDTPPIEKRLPFCEEGDTERIKDWKSHLYSIITYIKWKFNIEEEDLK